MSAQSGFRTQVERERPYLVRFASLQLRDADAVEDAVQETLLAALAGEEHFAGRSNVRTWLTGILKHKIVDAIRRASREVPLSTGEETDGSQYDDLFTANGHWVEHPPAWDSPDASFEQKQFFQVFEQCLAGLPRRTAQAFLMREHLGVETDAICAELGVTANHCNVLLYRARMALQQCLHSRWFAHR